MDVDYNVVENKTSRIRHLSLDLEPKEILGSTVCGIDINPYGFGLIDFPLKKFWKSSFSCKNCKRAAKH